MSPLGDWWRRVWKQGHPIPDPVVPPGAPGSIPADDATLAKPPTLDVGYAKSLMERGDARAALAVLERLGGTGLGLIRAEAYEALGDLASARREVLAELAKDVAMPGANEFLRRLGPPAYEPRQAVSADRTIVGASAPTSPFLIKREVGRGGAATVYEAVDRRLGRSVALKVFHSRQGQERAALRREFSMTRALRGYGVIRVFDVDPAGSWLALEWARGGAISAGEAVRSDGHHLPPWAFQLARTLATLHARAVVHSDVKPSNVLCLDDERVVLSDFGVAVREGEPVLGGSPEFLPPDRGTIARATDDIFGWSRSVARVQDATQLLSCCSTILDGAGARKRFSNGGELSDELERIHPELIHSR